MLKIHGTLPSPFVRKVRCALDEKGIPYESVQLIPMPKTPELMALNPIGKIPILQDGDLTLPDSSAICAYIERLHPSPALYPSDPVEFARTLWYEEYADTKLVEGIAPIFFERFIKKHLLKVDPDEDRVKGALENELPASLEYLEKETAGRDHLVGGEFTLADIATCAQLVGLRLGGEDLDATRWPNLARYLETNLARPTFKALLAEEGIA